MPPAQFFPFEIFDKAFHNRIVIGVAFLGEGLNHVKRIQFLSEIGRSKLSFPVGVEHHALRNASVPDSVPEGIQSQTSPAGCWPGKQ